MEHRLSLSDLRLRSSFDVTFGSVRRHVTVELVEIGLLLLEGPSAFVTVSCRGAML
jgi:hypothetical protein